jgi:hypothetical protein
VRGAASNGRPYRDVRREDRQEIDGESPLQ